MDVPARTSHVNGLVAGNTPFSPIAAGVAKGRGGSAQATDKTETIFAGQGKKTHETHETHTLQADEKLPAATVALTVIENSNGPAAKVFSLDAEGALLKRSAAMIYEGQARVIVVAGVRGLLTAIDGLANNQALAYGVPERHEARILTREDMRRGAIADAIARDREHFKFSDGRLGILMLDHDPRPGHPPMDWREIDAILCDVMPSWRGVERAWRPSSSAFIYATAGNRELIGPGGWRCYVVVDDASAIPAVGAAIYQALWKAGHGYVIVSKSGQALDRSLFDASVFQPERLDFAAPPVIGEGLSRRARSSEIIPGGPMLESGELRSAPPMRDWRATSPELKASRAAAKSEIEKARKAFVAARVAELTCEAAKTRAKTTPARLKAVVRRAVESRALSGEFVLHRPNGTTVTVAELLADSDKWDGARIADPLEPDYRGDARIAVAELRPDDGEPYIYSHAHGGMRYSLVRESAEIRLVAGEQPRAVDEALALLRSRNEVYERGGELVRLANGGIAPANDEWTLDYLGRHVRFLAARVRGEDVAWVRKDAPPWIARRINAKSGERGLRELRAVITAPTLRPDGSLLATPGYDDASELLLRAGHWPHIPDAPSHDELRAAAAALWRPFAEFPFVDDVARGVLLAALFTATLRRTLPLAPAFSFDAPAASSGKTLLATCVARLADPQPAASPSCEDDEEIRKGVTSALREGQASILFDNISGVFKSSIIEALLTSETWRDRVLGATQTITVPTNALVLFSGNNFRPAGDLWRRILTCRIDAKTDAPERRGFALDVGAYCNTHRQELIAAALTLLRGFVAAGAPRACADKLGSFETWDSRVRQAILWIGKEGLMPEGASVADPVKAIDAAKVVEPERQRLAAFLDATRAVMADGRWRVADLITRSDEAVLSPIACEAAESPAGPLRDALDEIAGERGKINPRILGRWIERQADRRCDGLWLERAGERQHAVLWKVLGTDKATV